MSNGQPSKKAASAKKAASTKKKKASKKSARKPARAAKKKDSGAGVETPNPEIAAIHEYAVLFKTRFEQKAWTALAKMLPAEVWVNDRGVERRNFLKDAEEKLENADDIELSLTKILRSSLEKGSAHVSAQCQLFYADSDTWEESEASLILNFGFKISANLDVSLAYFGLESDSAPVAARSLAQNGTNYFDAVPMLAALAQNPAATSYFSQMASPQAAAAAPADYFAAMPTAAVSAAAQYFGQIPEVANYFAQDPGAAAAAAGYFAQLPEAGYFAQLSAEPGYFAQMPQPGYFAQMAGPSDYFGQLGGTAPYFAQLPQAGPAAAMAPGPAPASAPPAGPGEPPVALPGGRSHLIYIPAIVPESALKSIFG